MTTEIKQYWTDAEKAAMSNEEIEARIIELMRVHQGGFGGALTNSSENQEVNTNDSNTSAIEEFISRHPYDWVFSENN